MTVVTFPKAKMAGFYRLRGYLRRLPDLTWRKKKATSADFSLSFNEVAVSKNLYFFSKVIDEHHLTSDKIFSVEVPT